MGAKFYQACRLVGRFIRVQCIRQTVEGLDNVPSTGPALLAVTHISHLEPMVVSIVLTRQIRWMARVEFYQALWARKVLGWGGAFPVDRFGWSLPAVRRATKLLREREVVGMFPEGGVAQGAQSVLRGGQIKQGVCTISFATRTPIIPVVVLGTHELNRIRPWLPFRRGRLWIRFGPPVPPPSPGTPRRSARRNQAAALESVFRSMLAEMRAAHSLPDAVVP